MTTITSLLMTITVNHFGIHPLTEKMIKEDIKEKFVRQRVKERSQGGLLVSDPGKQSVQEIRKRGDNKKTEGIEVLIIYDRRYQYRNDNYPGNCQGIGNIQDFQRRISLRRRLRDLHLIMAIKLRVN